MSFAPGAHLGPYEVMSLLGSGGMGEVYRAKDSRLNRDVALKVLPDAFTCDGDRLARFRREAQVLAALNHPHIGAIFGIEETPATGGDSPVVQALVLELVEGPTLADRIAQGPVPFDEALPIAQQIADALEAAHEQAIVHRDLKPANIKLRPDGTVKVLDFGLAKAVEAAPAAGSILSPTITSPALMTAAGVILGTAAYMAPEQAKGRPADKRSDVWAFGCVLFEMLSGRRPFDGEDMTDVLGAVVRLEPDWAALPADVPPAIRMLLQRCLVKDRRQRVSDIAAAKFVLGELQSVGRAEPTVAARRRPAERWMAALLAVALVAIAGMAALLWSRGRATSAPPVVARFLIPLPPELTFDANGLRTHAISPDGRSIVFAAKKTAEDLFTTRLYLRSMADPIPKVIPGSEGVGNLGDPVFSPDGQAIAYYSGPRTRANDDALKGGALKRISVNGGKAATLCQAELPLGITWAGDAILFAQAGKGIFRVPDQGGEPQMIIAVKEGELPQRPQLLPDGETVLFALARGVIANRPGAPSNPVERHWDSADIVAESITSHKRTLLIPGGSDARFLTSGHLVFAVAGALRAVAFDPSRLKAIGQPVPILDGVARARLGAPTRTGAAHAAVSETGSLVYLPGPLTPTASVRNLAILGVTDEAEPLTLKPARYEFPRVSPDGNLIAVGINDDSEANVWVYDLRSKQLTQLTSGGKNRYPIWSADSRRVAFQSDRGGDLAIWSQRVNGQAPAVRLTTAEKDTAHIPDAWLSSGDLFFDVSVGSDFALWKWSGRDRNAAPFGGVQSTVPPAASVSWDGRWVAYQASADGRSRIVVQPIPPTGDTFSVAEGSFPRWASDGPKLFFAQIGRINSVEITTQPRFGVVGRPEIVADARAGGPRQWDRMSDGRFIGILDENSPSTGVIRTIEVVLNWLEELKTRVPIR